MTSVSLFTHELYAISDILKLADRAMLFCNNCYLQMYSLEKNWPIAKDFLFAAPFEDLPEAASYRQWVRCAKQRREKAGKKINPRVPHLFDIEDYRHYVEKIMFFVAYKHEVYYPNSMLIVTSLSDNFDWGFDACECSPIVAEIRQGTLPMLIFKGSAEICRSKQDCEAPTKRINDIGVELEVYVAEVAQIYYKFECLKVSQGDIYFRDFDGCLPYNKLMEICQESLRTELECRNEADVMGIDHLPKWVVKMGSLNKE